MRLIDADALMNASYTLQGGTEEYHFGFDDGYRYFQREVVGVAPTIDAVPVVRCRECKHGSFNEYYGNVICSAHFCRRGPNYFCADGQRREDGDNT